MLFLNNAIKLLFNQLSVYHEKSVVVCFRIFAATFAQAQEEGSSSEPFTSKRGLVITPEVGDVALSVDALPYISYLGNIANGNTGNGLNSPFSAAMPFTVQGRYVASNKMYYRVGFALGISSETFKSANATDPKKEDKTVVSDRLLALSAGVEFNKSIRGRLRGYYGADLMVMTKSGENTLNGYDGGTITFTPAEGASSKVSGGGMFGVGLNALAGVEYFIAPKISLGAEVHWTALSFNSTSKTKTKLGNAEEVVTPGVSSFGIGNGIANLNPVSGRLNLSFYF